MEEKQQSFSSMFRQLPPVFAFWAGVITTAAVLFALGFVTLVILATKDIDLGSAGNTGSGKTNTNVARANTNTSAAPTVAKTIDTKTLSHFRGEGDLTIVEFSDLECPFCKDFHVTMQQVMEKYDGKVRWAYKHFPLNRHAKAPREAEASECASDQGKFWEYIDSVYERTTSNDGLADSELYTVADELGLDRKKFDACLEDGTFENIVSTDLAEAQALGGSGTPFVLVIDKDGKVVSTIPGALPLSDERPGRPSMTSILDELL